MGHHQSNKMTVTYIYILVVGHGRRSHFTKYLAVGRKTEWIKIRAKQNPQEMNSWNRHEVRTQRGQPKMLRCGTSFSPHFKIRMPASSGQGAVLPTKLPDLSLMVVILLVLVGTSEDKFSLDPLYRHSNCKECQHRFASPGLKCHQHTEV